MARHYGQLALTDSACQLAQEGQMAHLPSAVSRSDVDQSACDKGTHVKTDVKALRNARTALFHSHDLSQPQRFSVSVRRQHHG